MNESITLQVGVKALLKNQDDKFLLLRRNPERYPEAGATWDIVGGRIEPGHSLMENLQREVREETGLSLNSAIQLISAQDILKIPGKHIVRLTYIGSIEGEPVLDEDHNEYQWFTADELRSLNDLDQFLAAILEEVLGAAEKI